MMTAQECNRGIQNNQQFFDMTCQYDWYRELICARIMFGRHPIRILLDARAKTTELLVIIDSVNQRIERSLWKSNGNILIGDEFRESTSLLRRCLFQWWDLIHHWFLDCLISNKERKEQTIQERSGSRVTQRKRKVPDQKSYFYWPDEFPLPLRL